MSSLTLISIWNATLFRQIFLVINKSLPFQTSSLHVRRFKVFTLPVVWMKTLVLGPMFWPSVKALLPRRRSVPQKASQHDLVGGGLIKKVKNLLICVTCCSMLDKSSFVCYVQIASFFLNKTSIEWTSILFLNIPHRVHSSRVHRLGSSQKSIWNEPYPNLAVDRFPGPNNKKTPKRVTGWFRDIPLGVMGMNPLWALERWQKHTWDMPMAQRKRLAIRKVMGWNGTSKMLWRHSYLDIFNICEPDDVILSLQVLL